MTTRLKDISVSTFNAHKPVSVRAQFQLCAVLYAANGKRRPRLKHVRVALYNTFDFLFIPKGPMWLETNRIQVHSKKCISKHIHAPSLLAFNQRIEAYSKFASILIVKTFVYNA